MEKPLRRDGPRHPLLRVVGMSAAGLVDRLHRMEKLLLQNGEASSLKQAQEILASYTMQILVGPGVAASPALQVALLSAVNAGRRAVHGEVRVVGDASASLLIPIPGCSTLAEAVDMLGGTLSSRPSPTSPALLFGDASPPPVPVVVRGVCMGLSGGVVPADMTGPVLDPHATSLAGALAASIGVSELFQALRGKNARAGNRVIGLSAWDPAIDWMSPEARGPTLEWLPSAIWVIGMGHLGQSLLWNLSFLPYSEPYRVNLVLQDVDRVTASNYSTSPVTFPSAVDRMKTRVTAEWAEHAGFTTRLVERLFTGDVVLDANEPRLAFCGVDNIEARAALERPGFAAVVEAGLGTGEEYHAFQLHTFSGPEEAVTRWTAKRDQAEPVLSEALEAVADSEDLDACGRAELAGVQVASSFVGIAATALAIGQMLRPLHGAVMHGAVDGTLGSGAAPRTVSGTVGERAPRYASVAATTRGVGEPTRQVVSLNLCKSG